MSGIVPLNRDLTNTLVNSFENQGLTSFLADNIIGNKKKARTMMLAAVQEDFFSNFFSVSVKEEIGWKDLKKITQFTLDFRNVDAPKNKEFFAERTQKGVYDTSYGFIALSAHGDYSIFGKKFSEQKRVISHLFNGRLLDFPNAPTILFILGVLRSRGIPFPPCTIQTSSHISLKERSFRPGEETEIKDWHVVILVGQDSFHVYLYPDGKGRILGAFPVDRLYDAD